MSSLGRLPGWQQDLLALLLLGMLLAGFATAFLELRDTTRDLRAKADATGRSIPKVEQFIDSRQALEDLRQTLETDGSDKASLLLARSPNLAGAELQQRLNTIIENRGGRVDTSLVLAQNDDGRFQRITVRVNAALDVAQLQGVLWEIESGEPLLFVEEMAIQPTKTRRDQQARNQRPNLQVSLTVHGFISALEASDG